MLSGDSMTTTTGNSDRVDPYVLKIAITIVIGALAVVFDATRRRADIQTGRLIRAGP
jgi:hypothetical protein